MKQLSQFSSTATATMSVPRTTQASTETTTPKDKSMDPTNVKPAAIEIPIQVMKKPVMAAAASSKRHTISRATLQSYIIANEVELIHLNDTSNQLSSSSSSSIASSTSSSKAKQHQQKPVVAAAAAAAAENKNKPLSHTWTKLDLKASRQQLQRVKQQQRLLDQQRQEDELKIAEFLYNSKRPLNTLLVSSTSANFSRSLESLSSSSLQSPLSSLSSSSFNNNNNNNSNSCTNTIKIKTTLFAGSPDQSYVMTSSKMTASFSPNSTLTSAASSSSSSSSATAGYALVDPNKIHLFVKGGQDGRSQGACPFCQDVFLQLLIKAQTNQFNFDVITINLENPPKEFKDLAIKPPVLIHGRSAMTPGESGDQQPNNLNAVILSDVDEIAEYLDRLYPNSKLTVENPEAKKVCLNVFSRFSYFIRDVSSKSTSLEAELEKINAYLGAQNTANANANAENRTFLNGKSLTALDCSLLPKLQHIRVAAESVKRFRIPYRFEHLWRYIKNAYETDAFQKSCPPDREIIWHWSKTNLSHKDILQIMQEQPYRTLTVPDDLKL